jgi:iron complex transport system substrate-binding protein
VRRALIKHILKTQNTTYLVGLILLLLTSLPATAEIQPRRVVSINLCSDQLLLLLADPRQVASVSHLATQPASSFVAEQAAQYPLNHARLEEIIGLRPDLVLTSSNINPRLTSTLELLGFELFSLSHSHTIKEIIGDIRRLAARLGREQRGEALITQMQQRLHSSDDPAIPHRPTALFYQPRGYTSGAKTLQNEALRLAGWRNPAAEEGIEGYRQVPLEQIILWQPDTLFTSTYSESSRGLSLAERQLQHPALKRLLGKRPMLEIPYRYWICPGPMLAEAVTLLREAKTLSANDKDEMIVTEP